MVWVRGVGTVLGEGEGALDLGHGVVVFEQEDIAGVTVFNEFFLNYELEILKMWDFEYLIEMILPSEAILRRPLDGTKPLPRILRILRL